ncbi:hypothetical protein [Nitrospina gracilis]|uniref:hypothetical protein n=1 Tax=Nitrospina gracilis TaxID=35801 RepID=UPI001F17BC3D|nr:hypothetical protein [Nitrospina gracilis]MCF8719202.1 hypothetical protein [Nitrospina gracilis Nb-211]
MKRFFFLLSGVLLAGVLYFAPVAEAIQYWADELITDGSVDFKEQASTPSNPASGRQKLYLKDDGNLYQLDSGGNTNPVTSKGYKNAVINGDFRIWQRGTSFTLTAGGYTADRWFSENGDGGRTVTRESFALGQTDVPGEPEFFYRHNQTTQSTVGHGLLVQRIEGVRTFAGETITYSFWAKADSAISNLSIDWIQHFGSGGSPSPNVDSDNINFNVTTAWKKFVYTFNIDSIAGKQLGTNGNDYFEIRIISSGNNGTYNLDIARVQLEKGSIATPFERRPLGTELALCQRYYEKSYGFNVDPGSSETKGTILVSLWNGANGNVARDSVQFKVEKRVNPTMSYWDVQGTANQVTVNGGIHEAPAFNTPVHLPSTTGFLVVMDTTTAGKGMEFHWMADAEL